jgi:hypothetical protein
MATRLSIATVVIMVCAALVGTARAQVTTTQDNDALYGAPNFRSWPLGYYVWTDEDGVHVRWTSNANEHRRFSGELAVQGSILSLQPVYPERGTIGQTRTGTIAWDASNSGGGDGFELGVAQNSVVRLSMWIDGRPASGGEVFLGRTGAHPYSNTLMFRYGFPVVGGPGPLPGPGVPGPYPGSSDRWPGYARGQPRFGSLPSAGYVIWVDNNDWQLRWSATRLGRDASGLVSTDGRFGEVRKVRLEAGDLVARHESLIAWETRTDGRGGYGDGRAEVDGIAFRTSGERLTFTLLVGGAPVQPSLIYLGATGARPQGNPFTIAR